MTERNEFEAMLDQQHAAGRNAEAGALMDKIEELETRVRELEAENIKSGEAIDHWHDVAEGWAFKVRELEAKLAGIYKQADDATEYVLALINADLRAKLARVVTGYQEAIEDIQGWGCYAAEYFQDKHDLKGCVARHKAILQEEPK